MKAPTPKWNLKAMEEKTRKHIKHTMECFERWLSGKRNETDNKK